MMNPPVLLAVLAFLVMWSFAEGLQPKNLFFVDQLNTFNYRANERCLNEPKSSPWKTASLMMDLMKNLEGEKNSILNNLTNILILSDLPRETMQIEPAHGKIKHSMKEFEMFPKIVGVVWLAITDPVGVKQSGWCSLKKINQFMSISSPAEVEKKVQSLELSIRRDIKLILENFIKSINFPVNTYVKRPSLELTKFYKATAKHYKKSDIEMTTVLGYKSPIPRSILELDTDESQEEMIDNPISNPTATKTQTTQTILTRASLNMPKLRKKFQTTTPFTPATEIKKKETTRIWVLTEGDEDSDSGEEIDITTKLPFQTKITTKDDGSYRDNGIGRRSTLRHVDHMPIMAPAIEAEPSEDDSYSEFAKLIKKSTPDTSTDSKPKTSTNAVKKKSFTSKGKKLRFRPADLFIANQNDEADDEDKNTENDDEQNDHVISNRRATIGPQAFTEDDTRQFMKLVSVDEDKHKSVSDIDREVTEDRSNSNLGTYAWELVILICNVIFWL